MTRLLAALTLAAALLVAPTAEAKPRIPRPPGHPAVMCWVDYYEDENRVIQITDAGCVRAWVLPRHASAERVRYDYAGAGTLK